MVGHLPRRFAACLWLQTLASPFRVAALNPPYVLADRGSVMPSPLPTSAAVCG